MKSLMVRRIGMVIAAAVLLAAIVPGLRYYRYLQNHVWTDDAYVDGTSDLIASRVDGTVEGVLVRDNWVVKKGDLLVTLDPRDFQVRIDQAGARLARARQTVDELFSELAAAQAAQRLAASQLRQAHLDYSRAVSLHEKGVVSREFYDRAATGLKVGEANEALAAEEVERARAALNGETQDHSRYDRPIVRQAEAELHAASLDLEYTRIQSPVAGVITHKTVHVGNRVRIGEPLMSIVPIDSLYVTANYKETQMTHVRVGQKAEFEVDIYPGYVYRGRVDSIAAGTGAAFALLPPENATGNWVKVVQRVPVKIIPDEPPPPDKVLRMGLSVEATIDVADDRKPLVASVLQREFERAKSLGQRITRPFY